MVEEKTLQDSCWKYHGIAGRGVEGVDDGDVGVVAPVGLVHPLPQPRVLVPPVPVGKAHLRQEVQLHLCSEDVYVF